jgi:hypothetical protein
MGVAIYLRYYDIDCHICPCRLVVGGVRVNLINSDMFLAHWQGHAA